MEAPLELLKRHLSVFQLVASGRGFSKKKSEAKKLIPLYENAIGELEQTDAINHNFDVTCEKKNKEEFLTEDYVIQKTNGEVIYEGDFQSCLGFMRGFYYNGKKREIKVTQADANYLKELWNNYLKLVSIIDGIISEEGELSTSYWKDGLESELDNITSSINTIQDISDNKQKIIDNFKSLLDGINGRVSEGKSISRYGSLAEINKTYFK